MLLLTALSNTNSKLDKQKMLKGIPYLEWKTFVCAYNPYYIYHLKFKEFDIDNLGEPSEKMFEVLEKILAGKIARGDAARTRVKKFAAINGDLIKLIVNKDLRCGTSAALFNSVHAGSIPQFKIQLAKEVPIIDLSYPMLAQIKYDGARLVAINREGKVKFHTSSGKEVNLPMLRKILEDQPYINYVLDGEITLVTGKQEDRSKICGMINSAMHGGTVIETNMRHQIFDFMTLSQWEDSKCPDAYHVRYSAVLDLLGQIRSDYFIPANTILISNAEDANDYYQGVLSEGYEGIILKDSDHLYTFKRSKDWIKVKETKTADLKCVSFEPGEAQGKYEGLIGGLICIGIVEDKEVVVKVSGMTIMAASMPFETTYADRVIEVKYNSVIQDSKTGKYSLFLSRFSCVRFDK